MAEHSRFFDSLNPLEPDRTYTAEEFTSYFHALITTGIMKGAANMLKVETSGSNMNTSVDTGTAFLLGRQYVNDSKLSLTHEIETLGRSRIDRVVLRLVLDMDARYIRAFVKKGIAGTAPIAPPLTRDGSVYEISLAQVKVIGGQTYINATHVTDERGNPDVCPWAASRILPHFDDNALAEHIADRILHVRERQEEWIPAVLQAPWSNAAGELSFYKDQFGIVHLYGVVKGFSESVNRQLTTLPVGYRPSSNFYGTAFLFTKPNTPVTVSITTDGVVMIEGATGASTVNGVIDIQFRT